MTAGTLALALGLLLAAPDRPALSLSVYRAKLSQLETLLLQRDRDGAATAARSLLPERVDWGGEVLPVDRAVLERIVDAKQEGVVSPLRALLAAVPSLAETSAGTPSLDRPALAALAEREAERAASGALGGPALGKFSLSETVRSWLKSAGHWLVERARAAWHWLRKWLESSRAQEVRAEGSSLVTLVLLGVGVILVTLVLAALLTLRRRETLPPQGAVGQPADVDADPRSRTADAWEDRARALALAGRHREAIRAWYHALLVSCYRAGLLHHQTGRTNWEYARSLGPDVHWRGQFAELTGRFDLEWYGRAHSSPEALDAFAGEAGVILADLGGAPA